MAVKSLLSRYSIPLVWPRLAMDLAKVDTIAIHHSVTPTLSANATEAQEIAWIDKIHAYHKSKGFGGIGYHLMVFPSKRVYLVCSLKKWGANVGGHNNHVYGVCLVGDLTNTGPTQGHLVGGAIACKFIDSFLKAQKVTKPHNAFGGTVCPGKATPHSVKIRSYLPVPTPSGIWAYVKPVSKSVTLQVATPLKNLETSAIVKTLAKGTKLAVAAQYKSSYYLTPYSYSNKIPNGFAISATVAPTCQAEKARIIALEQERKDLIEKIARLRRSRDALQTKYDSSLVKVRQLTDKINRAKVALS